MCTQLTIGCVRSVSSSLPRVPATRAGGLTDSSLISLQKTYDTPLWNYRFPPNLCGKFEIETHFGTVVWQWVFIIQPLLEDIRIICILLVLNLLEESLVKSASLMFLTANVMWTHLKNRKEIIYWEGTYCKFSFVEEFFESDNSYR